MRYIPRHVHHRVLAATLATVTFWSMAPAHGDPADVFSIPAPTIGADPPKASSLAAGDASVSSQTGAFDYGYPIAVPPGRNGMQPKLALSYSSQGAIYGGIASGWSMPVPTISLDTSAGRLWQQSSYYPTARWVSSMAGGQPLIQVTEPAGSDVSLTFRAKNDASFTRYEQITGGYIPSVGSWRARTSDGKTFQFGQPSHVDGTFVGGSACANIGTNYAPLTRAVDSFGNAVDYYYRAGVTGECLLAAVTWGQNATAGTSDFARINLSYSVTQGNGCPAGTLVGAQTSYRDGTLRVSGASQLDSIVVTAYAPGLSGTPDHTRTISLSYAPVTMSDEQTTTCTSTHAAFRTLYSIRESAVGTDSPRVDLPPVTFGYGSAQLQWPAPVTHNLPWTYVAPNPSTGAGYNLGWGYRFDTATGSDPTRWPTVEATMVDIDGDGLVDRLFSAPQTSAGQYYCHAQWLRNKGNFQFEGTPRDIPLPTLKWATPIGSPNAYTGSPTPNQYQSADRAIEGCALNYQRTNYRNSNANSGVGYACHTSSGPDGYCNDPNAADYGTTSTVPLSDQPTYLSYRWFDINGDGLVDLVASQTTGTRYNLEWGDGINAPPEPQIFGPFPHCPSLLYGGTSVGPMCRMYPWMIYLNKGNGQFGKSTSSTTTPVPDQITYEPISLETDTGDSALTASPIGQDEGAFDLDGDGYPDAVIASTTWPYWFTFRNDSNGVLGPDPATRNTAFNFNGGGERLSSSYPMTDATGHVSPISASGVIDLNGDGLQDLWVESGTGGTGADIFWNDGVTMSYQGIESSSVRPGTDGMTTCYGGCSSSHSVTYDPILKRTVETWFSIEAQRWDSRRVLDLDLDGRPDVNVLAPSAPYTPSIFYNHGAVFGSSVAPPIDQTSLLHKIVVTNQMAWPNDTWEVRSDITDLDGDGIPEGIVFTDHTNAAGTMLISKIATATPPRLMTSVANGRGATTSVAYAAITDPTVVTRDAGVAMPRTQWVVKSMTTTDSFASTTSTSTYAYKNPRFTAEGDLNREGGMIDVASPMVNGPYHKFGFRGFDEVTTTGPSGAKTVQRYHYDVDWSGRLATTLVIPAEAPTEVRSIEDTTWEPRYLFCDRLFGCSVKTYHAVKVDHWACKNGQTEAQCRTNTDTLTESVATLSGMGSTTVPGGPWLLWTETSTRMSSIYEAAAPYNPQNGDRVVDTSYVVAADATDYRLLPSSETHSVITAGTPVAFSKVAHTFDANNLVATSDDVWLASDGSAHAITDRVYDMTTGNVLQTRRPNQHASGPYATLTYDARKLFPATAVNELGHKVDFKYEYGTGTKLETLGPNTATCVAANNCPAGSVPRQDQRIRIDGIGRTIETYTTVSNNGASFTPYKVGIDTYTDAGPSSVTHQQAIDANGSGIVSYTKSITTLDGHARPIKTTAFVLGSAPVDAVTTYHYGNDGTLQSVTVPDPTANDTSTVTYTYAYDSLGRPTSIRRPDSTVLASRSGVDMAYNGLVTTTSEFVNAGDGKPATTRATHDAFGRLVKVEEALSGAPIAAWAATTYAYDAADRITQITDPQNVVTTLKYDFAGRRTGVVRPGATWTFTYDADGNVATSATPNTCAVADSVCAAQYVSTYAYDALDRMTTKQVAHRDLTRDDLALFAVDTEKYFWDSSSPSPGTYIGQMTQWRATGPAGVNPQTLSYRKDAAGRDVSISLATAAAGTTLSRVYQEQFALDGAPNYVAYHDLVGGSNSTTATLAYDARGLPLSITPTVGGVYGALKMGVQTRNVAGLVTKRHTDQTTAMTFVESNWTYDKLGRVASQIVQQGPGPVRVAEQDLAYFGNDDPKTLDQYLGTGHKQLAYGYDNRHQLLSARESTTAGAFFTGTYTYGNAGRFATAVESATAPGANSDVTPRNVAYVYGGTDPEEVTALKNGAATFASYAYDPSGNQTATCTGGPTTACTGQSVEYVYDGNDRLRRATKKRNGVVQGSEEYWYANAEQRIATVQRDATGAKTGTIVWLRDTEAHYDATNAVANVYSYLSLGTAVARVNRTGNTTATTEYTFHGQASNTLAAIDSTGVVEASFSYAPFGEIVEATNGGGASDGVAAHRRRMNDKYVDEATNLAYYGARYYDKTLIGWTQMDPLYRFAPDARWSAPRRGNVYEFSLENPLRFIDPDGRDSFGADEFFSHTDKNSVAGVGATIEGGGWGPIAGPGETITTAARTMKKIGLPISRPPMFGGGDIMSPYGSDPCNGVTSLCEGPMGGMFDSLHIDVKNRTITTEDATPFETVVGLAMVGAASWAVAGLIVGGGEVALPAAAGAARGFQSPTQGGTFDDVTNAAGGTVWTSTGNIDINDVQTIVNSTPASQTINILTGVHGYPDGSVVQDAQLFLDDVNAFGGSPNVSVYNVLSLGPSQISSLLNSAGVTIGAFCNSGKCLEHL